MPIYEYRCPDCGETSEVLDLRDRATQETDPLPVPLCGGHDGPVQMQLIPSAGSFQQGRGPKESNISRAIRNVKRAEAEGRLPPDPPVIHR